MFRHYDKRAIEGRDSTFGQPNEEVVLPAKRKRRNITAVATAELDSLVEDYRTKAYRHQDLGIKYNLGVTAVARLLKDVDSEAGYCSKLKARRLMKSDKIKKVVKQSLDCLHEFKHIWRANQI